jgi:hypothetical protein
MTVLVIHAGFLCFIGSINEIVSIREDITSVWEDVVKKTSAIVRTDTMMVDKIRRVEIHPVIYVVF